MKKSNYLKFNESDIQTIDIEKAKYFIDNWLIQSRRMKQNKDFINLVQILTPYFSYTGKMYRGIYLPIGNIKTGLTLESWCKTKKSITKVEKYANYSFGSIHWSNNDIYLYNSEEFIEHNKEARKEKFDKIIESNHVGLDLFKLAEHINYRNDYLNVLKEVNEIIVINNIESENDLFS